MSESLKMLEFLDESSPTEKQLLNLASELCIERRGRLTTLRKVVLIIISRRRGGLKAYEILEIIRNLLPKAAPPTVYRSLNFLLSMKLICKVNTCQTFNVCLSNEQPTAEAILVCPGCNRQTKVADCALIRKLELTMENHQFASRPRIIEIVTLCSECIL